MANRRYLQTLTTRLYSNSSLHCLKTTTPNALQYLIPELPKPLNPELLFHPISPNLNPSHFSSISRNFSSGQRGGHENDSAGDDDEIEDDDDDHDGEEMEGDFDDDDSVGSGRVEERDFTVEERANEAAAIGYKVIGQLERSDRVFKLYEPVFAVIQIGSHQFKVSNGDCIYTERLKFCNVHDKLILNKVLMLGSKTQTMIGRPVLPDAAVHAVVEEHALDAKVIIFKKKRRKNYRRKNGHRQELTKLRITDIQGIEKPEKSTKVEKKKSSVKKVETVALPA